MKNSNKIGWGWVAFAYVVMHFGLIVLYAFPPGYLPPQAKSFAAGYVQPFFSQTWALFAPAPLVDDSLEVKYYFSDDSTDWVDPAAGAASIHSRVPFLHYGDLVLGQSNLLYWIQTELDAMGISEYEPFPPEKVSAFRNTMGYFRLRGYVYGNAGYLYDRKPERALVRCSFRNVKTGEYGTMILPELEWKK